MGVAMAKSGQEIIHQCGLFDACQAMIETLEPEVYFSSSMPWQCRLAWFKSFTWTGSFTGLSLKSSVSP